MSEFKCGDRVLLLERKDQPFGVGVVVNPDPDHLGEIGVRWDFNPDTIYGQLPADLMFEDFEKQYFHDCGGVPFDHWGKGCPGDCPIPEHKR